MDNWATLSLVFITYCYYTKRYANCKQTHQRTCSKINVACLSKFAVLYSVSHSIEANSAWSSSISYNYTLSCNLGVFPGGRPWLAPPGPRRAHRRRRASASVDVVPKAPPPARADKEYGSLPLRIFFTAHKGVGGGLGTTVGVA